VGADGASDRKDSTSLRRETAALRDFGSADDGFGNFYASRPVAMCPGEGLLTEPTAATQIVTAATALHALEPSFREAPRGNADAIVAHLHQLQVLASHLGNFMRTLVMPQGGGVGGADQRAREADQDRREDREPPLLSHIPDDRGRGIAADVRRNPVVDCPAPGVNCVGMKSAGSDARDDDAEERLDAGKTRHLCASAGSTDWFDRLPWA